MSRTFLSLPEDENPAAAQRDINHAVSEQSMRDRVTEQAHSLIATSVLEQLLRWLHDAQYSGILSNSHYADLKAAAIARWLHAADQHIDQMNMPPDYAEDITAELGEHPHTLDLKEGQVQVFVTEPVAYLPVEKASMSSITALDPFQPGRTIRGRYVLEKLIGQGGFAHVYRAQDLRRDALDDSSRHVAVKVLRPEFRERPGTTSRLKREFRQTQRLPHPAIVRIFDLDAHDGVWFTVMELLEGETLARRLHRLADVPMPVPEAHALLAACANALSFAHSCHIVHGDFKPTNIFMLHDGSVRILDFGSSPEMTVDISGGKPDPINQVATPAYASPQVLAYSSAVPRDDLYSFACMAFEILAGYHPVRMRSSMKTQKSNDFVLESARLSPTLMVLLKQGLAECREDRPASVREFFQSLTALIAADREWRHLAAAVPTDITLTISPIMPAPNFPAAPRSPIADPEARPTPVARALLDASVAAATLTSVLAEVATPAAVRMTQQRNHTAMPSPITPKMSLVSSSGRIRLYSCAVLFMLTYLGLLALRSTGTELKANTSTRSIAPQTQITR